MRLSRKKIFREQDGGPGLQMRSSQTKRYRGVGLNFQIVFPVLHGGAVDRRVPGHARLVYGSEQDQRPGIGVYSPVGEIDDRLVAASRYDLAERGVPLGEEILCRGDVHQAKSDHNKSCCPHPYSSSPPAPLRSLARVPRPERHV